MPAEPEPAARSRPRSFWPRFTLRIVLVLMTLLCILLAIWTHRARAQRQLVERIGEVYYDYQGRIHYDERDDPSSPGLLERRSPVPQWLLDRLGVDFFHNVHVAWVQDQSVIPELYRLDLQELNIISDDVTDADIEHLTNLRNLDQITIFPHGRYSGRDPQLTPVTDRTLEIIGSLPRIEKVGLCGTGFTAEGLASLAKAKKLRMVYIASCDESVDAAAVAPFKMSGSVRDLKIVRWSDTKHDGGRTREEIILGMWGDYTKDD